MSSAIYATPEFVGHSLWLIPGVDAEKELHAAIQTLATRLDTPPFLPHATLLGGVVGMSSDQAAQKTKEIADRLRALDVEILTVATKERLYFQCVFGLLEPSNELAEAHRIVKEAFERVDETEFMPHVSFVYGDLLPEDRKQLAQELGPHFDGMKMKMEKLQLWNTTGAVTLWRKVAEFPLMN